MRKIVNGIVLLTTTVVVTSTFGASGKPAFAKPLKKVVKKVKEAGIDISKNDLLKKVLNTELDNFGFQQELFGVLFDLECNLPSLSSVGVNIPKVKDICEKSANGQIGVLDDKFKLNLGKCSIEISNPVDDNFKKNINTWCKDYTKIAKDKDGKPIKVKSTPIDIFVNASTTTESARDIIVSGGGAKNIKYPSGITDKELKKATSINALLDSNSPVLAEIAIEDDAYEKKRLEEYLKFVKGAKKEDYSPLNSLPLDEDIEQYEISVNEGAKRLVSEIHSSELQDEITSTLKGAYFDDKIAQLAKTIPLSEADTTEKAMKREKAIYDFLLKTDKPKIGVGLEIAKAKDADAIHSGELAALLNDLDINRVIEPTKEHFLRLEPTQRKKFKKAVYIQKRKDVLMKYLLLKLVELKSKQKDLALASAKTCASPFYPKVAFEEIQAMLRQIH